MSKPDSLTLYRRIASTVTPWIRQWHTGSKVGRTIYKGPGPDDLVGTMDRREDAAAVVKGLAALPELLTALEAACQEVETLRKGIKLYQSRMEYMKDNTRGLTEQDRNKIRDLEQAVFEWEMKQDSDGQDAGNDGKISS